MTRSDFIREIELSLQVPEGAFNERTVLKNVTGWDSIGRMNVVLVFDGLSIALPTGTLERAETVGDLVALTRLSV